MSRGRRRSGGGERWGVDGSGSRKGGVCFVGDTATTRVCGLELQGHLARCSVGGAE